MMHSFALVGVLLVGFCTHRACGGGVAPHPAPAGSDGELEAAWTPLTTANGNKGVVQIVNADSEILKEWEGEDVSDYFGHFAAWAPDGSMLAVASPLYTSGCPDGDSECGMVVVFNTSSADVEEWSELWRVHGQTGGDKLGLADIGDATIPSLYWNAKGSLLAIKSLEWSTGCPDDADDCVAVHIFEARDGTPRAAVVAGEGSDCGFPVGVADAPWVLLHTGAVADGEAVEWGVGDVVASFAGESGAFFPCPTTMVWEAVMEVEGYIRSSEQLPSVSISRDGTMIAVATTAKQGLFNEGPTWSGDAYVSTDSGSTWSEVYTGSYGSQAYSVALSGDGLLLVMPTAPFETTGDTSRSVQISNSWGTEWNKTLTEQDGVWKSVVVSDDGAVIAMIEEDEGCIWTSFDSGETWHSGDCGRFWLALDLSGDGSTLIAADYAGNVVVGERSTAGLGVAWTAEFTPSEPMTIDVVSTAVSLDGTRLAVAFSCDVPCEMMWAGDLYVSSDRGATWSMAVEGANHQATSVDTSDDGSILVVTLGGVDSTYNQGRRIVVSRDWGETWEDSFEPYEANGSTMSFASSSADGSVLAATEKDGLFGDCIWTSHDAGLTWRADMCSSWWQAMSMSHDGSTIVALDNDDVVWVGSTLAPDTAPPDASAGAHAAYTSSVHSSTIVYVNETGAGAVWVVVDGEEVFRLVGDGDLDSLGADGIDWSPDGQRFAIRSSTFTSSCVPFQGRAPTNCGAVHMVHLLEGHWEVQWWYKGMGGGDRLGESGGFWHESSLLYALLSESWESGCNGGEACGAVHMFVAETGDFVDALGGCSAHPVGSEGTAATQVWSRGIDGAGLGPAWGDDDSTATVTTIVQCLDLAEGSSCSEGYAWDASANECLEELPQDGGTVVFAIELMEASTFDSTFDRRLDVFGSADYGGAYEDVEVLFTEAIAAALEVFTDRVVVVHDSRDSDESEDGHDEAVTGEDSVWVVTLAVQPPPDAQPGHSGRATAELVKSLLVAVAGDPGSHLGPSVTLQYGTPTVNNAALSGDVLAVDSISELQRYSQRLRRWGDPSSAGAGTGGGGVAFLEGMSDSRWRTTRWSPCAAVAQTGTPVSDTCVQRRFVTCVEVFRASQDIDSAPCSSVPEPPATRRCQCPLVGGDSECDASRIVPTLASIAPGTALNPGSSWLWVSRICEEQFGHDCSTPDLIVGGERYWVRDVESLGVITSCRE